MFTSVITRSNEPSLQRNKACSPSSANVTRTPRASSCSLRISRLTGLSSATNTFNSRLACGCGTLALSCGAVPCATCIKVRAIARMSYALTSHPRAVLCAWLRPDSVAMTRSPGPCCDCPEPATMSSRIASRSSASDTGNSCARAPQVLNQSTRLWPISLSGARTWMFRLRRSMSALLTSTPAITGRDICNEKLLPRPGSLTTRKLAPIISLSREQMDKPSPAPPARSLPPTWEKGLNRRVSCCSLIPIPVSDTCHCSDTWSGSMPITLSLRTTRPESVNLIALLSKLLMICRMRTASPHTSGGKFASAQANSFNPLLLAAAE